MTYAPVYYGFLISTSMYPPPHKWGPDSNISIKNLSFWKHNLHHTLDVECVLEEVIIIPGAENELNLEYWGKEGFTSLWFKYSNIELACIYLFLFIQSQIWFKFILVRFNTLVIMVQEIVRLRN